MIKIFTDIQTTNETIYRNKQTLKNRTFIEKYNALSFIEKKILQVLTNSYARLTQTQLLACFLALGIKTQDVKSYDCGTKTAMLKQFRNELDALLEGHFLLGTSRSSLVINRCYVEVLTRNLVAEKKFTALAGTIQ
jgi:hypothetical protein